MLLRGMTNLTTGPSSGIARRDFLGMLGASAASLSLGLAPAKSCILLLNDGGMSHLDSWDPKPDAPREVRGPFSAIPTRGDFQVSEVFPQIAKIADKLALIRSVTSPAVALHDVASAALRIKMPPLTPEASSTLEPLRTRERYGINPLGERLLSARRSVENGARFVTAKTDFSGPTWDIHGAHPFSTMDDFQHTVAPMFDRAFSALISDLHERGLLATTLVASLTEFGRAPWLNADGGRDHWTGCWSVCFAGAGVRGGRAIGQSDEHGAYPLDRPTSPQQLVATIHRILGIPSTAATTAIDDLF